jgi:hypothetical protein
MRIESDGHSRGNPRLFELIEHAPKTGKSPTVWAWPELIDYLKVAGQPVPGPWPPHQEPRPDPEEDSLPVAVAEPDPAFLPANERQASGSPGRLESVTPEAVGPDAATPEAAAPDAATPDAGLDTLLDSGSETAAEPSGWLHPESSLRDEPYGH